MDQVILNSIIIILRNFLFTHLWLREKLNSDKYLDQNNYQRLYEPSLLDAEIKFSKFSVVR